jgi:2-hydroxy-6-oxo-6-(2'-aminophenyl)hexa-2,4-dienoate hydrolase
MIELTEANTSKFVTINEKGLQNFKIHLNDAGRGDAVIMLHGGGPGAGGWSNFQRNIGHFVDAGYRVILQDAPGFNKSDPIVMEEQRGLVNARSVKGMMDALNIEKAHVIGNSMGGATALGVSVRRPDLVRALVLMGSAGLNVEISKELLPIVNYDFTREGMTRLIRALTNDRFAIDEDLVSYRFALAAEADTRRAYAATMGWIREQGGLYYAEDFICKVGVPTLVVNGKDDKVVPMASAFRFLELIDDSWGYIIPHCGHWAMIEHPESFAEATLSFIDARAGAHG